MTLVLADVLPAVAGSLGVASPRPLAAAWEPARRAVVVLVDGLGLELLRRRQGHAPFLRSLSEATRAATCGFPSTTATSMGTFGTGRPSGEHGLVGYEVLDPDTDRVFNELSWEDGPAPERWQPHATVFEQVESSGVSVTRIGPGFFDGSGLTRAALRGGRFVAADTLPARIDACVSAVRSTERALVYLYWGDLDKVGHVHGCQSWQWGDELESLDGALAALADRLPRDCSLTVTADHGMVDSPYEDRVDVATTPGMADGIRWVAGEARSLQLHCQAGAVGDVRAAWSATLGARALILDRDEAITRGLFGRVESRVRPRIGDLLVVSTGTYAVEDSRIHRPQLRALVGLHGGLTPDEVLVPVVHQVAGGLA